MLSQIVALLIFILVFIAITTGKVKRYIPSLAGGLLSLIIVFMVIEHDFQTVLNILNIQQFNQLEFWITGQERIASQGINWQTLVFITGMMLFVEGLGAAGFFRWLCLFVAKLVNYQVVPILITFMLVSGFLSMFIDSITVMLFLSITTIQLAKMLKFDPVPVIIAEIIAANIGGSATMSGDPPNIIIGTSLGYTFTDFLTNTGLIAWVGMAITLLFCFLVFRKILRKKPNVPEWSPPMRYPEPREAITDYRKFFIHVLIFVIVIVLLVTHAVTGLTVASIGIIAAGLTLSTDIRRALHLIKRIDWQTLLFFIGLFICVGSLQATSVLGSLAAFIGDLAGGSTIWVLTIILWVSAVASALVDNIPFAATMVPVIQNIALTSGISLPAQAWALSLGADIGGNATPIGASANVVGIAIAEKEGYRISWGKYCRYAIPATLLVIGVCWIYLILRYG